MPVTRENTQPLGVVYTPPDVARAMTRLALAPLVEDASSSAILALRICDPAAGAGAFLVEVVRYLSEHLVAAWHREHRSPTSHATDERAPSSSVRTWTREAHDLVARTCIVGVEIDPLALHSAVQHLAGSHTNLAIPPDHSATPARPHTPPPPVLPGLRTGDALSLDWRAAFPEIFKNGGFDVVLANPPYIRQESLVTKSSLEAYEVYDGVADLYVYFFELAHRLLRPRGRYCVIAPNKWMTVEYGRPLRRFLADAGTVDGIADLSNHALFANADAFPCIVWGTNGASHDRALVAVRATHNETVDQVLRRATSSVGSPIADRPRPHETVLRRSGVSTAEGSSPTTHVGTSPAAHVGTSSSSSRSADVGTSSSSARVGISSSSSPFVHVGTSSSSSSSAHVGTSSSSSRSADVGTSSSSPPAAHVGTSSSSSRSANVGTSSSSSPSAHVGAADPPPFESSLVPRERWSAEPWHIDSASDRSLLDRLAHSYPTLGDVIGGRWSRGVVTGLNEAFVIDQRARDSLVSADLGCASWIRPFIKGRDIRPYAPAPVERWLLLVDRGTSFDLLPAPIRAHLARFRERLEPKPTGYVGAWPGRKAGTYAWYELQDPVVPLAKSHAPRLLYQDIQTAPACSFDPHGDLIPDTTVWILPSSDRYLLAILNSRLYHWYARRRFPPALNGSVRPKLAYMQRLPIPTPSSDMRRELEALVSRRLGSTDPRAHEVLGHQIERLIEQAYELSSIERALVAY